MVSLSDSRHHKPSHELRLHAGGGRRLRAQPGGTLSGSAASHGCTRRPVRALPGLELPTEPSPGSKPKQACAESAEH